MNLLDLMVKIGVDDQASSKLDGISAGIIAKGNVMATAFTSALGAIGNAAQAVIGFGQSALDSYSSYEQLTGGVETLFKGSADTIMAYADQAFQTAGVSANKYMELATSFAASLIQSVAKSSHASAQASEVDVQSVSKALDDQVKAQQKAYEQQNRALQRSLDAEYKAREKSYQKSYEKYQDTLEEEVESLRKANSRKLKEIKKSHEDEVKSFESATRQKVKLIKSERDSALAAIDAETTARVKSIDDRIKALQGETDAERAEAEAQERAKKISELQKASEEEKTYAKRQKAREELAEYMAKIEREDRETARKKRIDALKDERDAIKDEASARKDAVKEKYSAELEAYKEARSEQLEQMREAQKEQEEALSESLSSQLQQLQKANTEKLKAMRESQQEQLEALKQSQQDQMQAERDSQQAHLDSMREAAAAQKEALAASVGAVDDFIEATDEDRAKAAELANMAVIDMSDNANKMGTSLESIQMAYQGFSKQNFTMLDNLKLGFGGTKGEMERLLDMAEQISAKEGEVRDFSIDSFADIVEAIHLVQKEYEISGYTQDQLAEKIKNRSLTEQELARVAQDNVSNYGSYEAALRAVTAAYEDGSLKVSDALILTGTTSREAQTTIEGSVNSMKAAWENWLAAIANPEMTYEEFQAKTDQLVETIGISLDNIVPKVAEIIGNVVTVLAERGPEIADKVYKAFMESLPPEVKEKFEDFLAKVDEAWRFLIDELIPTLGDTAASFAHLMETIKPLTDLIGMVLSAVLGEAAREVERAAECIGIMSDAASTAIEWLGSLGDQLSQLGNSLSEAAGSAADFFEDLADGASDGVQDVISFFEDLPGEVSSILDGMWDTLYDSGKSILDGFTQGIQSGFNDAIDAVSNGLNDIRQYLPFSPAKKGPFSGKGWTLYSGRSVMEAFGEGIGEGADGARDSMLDAMREVQGASGFDANGVGLSGAPGQAIGSAEGAGGVVIMIDHMEVREEQDISKVAAKLWTYSRRREEAVSWNRSFTTA